MECKLSTTIKSFWSLSNVKIQTIARLLTLDGYIPSIQSLSRFYTFVTGLCERITEVLFIDLKVAFYLQFFISTRYFIKYRKKPIRFCLINYHVWKRFYNWLKHWLRLIRLKELVLTKRVYNSRRLIKQSIFSFAVHRHQTRNNVQATNTVIFQRFLRFTAGSTTDNEQINRRLPDELQNTLRVMYCLNYCCERFQQVWHR